MEHAGGQRAGDGRGRRGGDPDPGVADDVAHLEHGGAQPLTDQTAPAVLPEGQHGEAHHLGAAARHRRAARKAGEPDGGADGRGGDGQRQRHADDHAHQNAHPEGLKHRGPLYEVAHGGGGGADGRGPPRRQAHAHQNGHQRRHENVDLRLLGHRLAQLGGDDGDEQHGQRAARALAAVQRGAAQRVGGVAHRGQREEHQRRGLKGVADGHSHGRAAHGGGVTAHRHQKVDVELGAQRVQDRADEQRAEQALCHGAQRVNAVPLAGYDDVFPFEELLNLSHRDHLFSKASARQSRQQNSPHIVSRHLYGLL